VSLVLCGSAASTVSQSLRMWYTCLAPKQGLRARHSFRCRGMSPMSSHSLHWGGTDLSSRFVSPMFSRLCRLLYQ